MPGSTALGKRLLVVTLGLGGLVCAVMGLSISMGSADIDAGKTLASLLGLGDPDPALASILWRIRLPRVLLAGLLGATLSMGGLVFQALLRNPLAEPYILGISGGAAIGAIIGILLGLSRFPGVGLMAFAGSMATLLVVLVMSSGKTLMKQDALLLSGVMVNAFCSAVIMFLVSITQDARLHNILFWLMGDLSMTDLGQVGILGLSILPCFVVIFALSNDMNLLLMGREMAHTMGVNTRVVSFVLLTVTSFMVSATVCHCGLVGFVGLVMPHLLRLLLGPDHRILVPASILGGGAYMMACDLLARVLPEQGEMPAGVVTALIGAPLFIYLLRRTRR